MKPAATSFLIAGTSGFAVELAGLVHDCGFTVAGFVGPRADARLPGPWLGGDEAVASHPGVPVLLAIGEPALRRRVVGALRNQGARFGTFIHPATLLSSAAEVGEGVIVYPNATVHARVRLDAYSFVNSNASVGHETTVGEFVTIGPGVALGGRITIGTGAYVGIGACILQGLTIAAGAVIGGGATVVDDITDAGTYVGTPARRLEGR